MMVPGYFLALSRRHVDAVADLDADEIADTYSWVSRLTQTWERWFGEYMVVEHGSCPGVKTGSCITHAHLHLVPLARTLAPTLLASRDVTWREISGPRALGSFKGSGYVSLQTSDGLWASSDICLPSQWLRQQIAEKLQLEVWDWALEPGLAQLGATLDRFSSEEISRCA
jgi:Diadenosine tetraphosphate (Ap4A) hydrolase and other HIT family hydrolases